MEFANKMRFNFIGDDTMRRRRHGEILKCESRDQGAQDSTLIYVGL